MECFEGLTSSIERVTRRGHQYVRTFGEDFRAASQLARNIGAPNSETVHFSADKVITMFARRFPFLKALPVCLLSTERLKPLCNKMYYIGERYNVDT